MDDILTSAQPVPPAPPPEPMPEPASPDASQGGPPMPPTSSDNIVVQPPSTPMPEMEKSAKGGSAFGRKGINPAVIITGILLLVAMPLAGLAVKNATEIRSQAKFNQKDIVKLGSSRAQKEYADAKDRSTTAIGKWVAKNAATNDVAKAEAAKYAELAQAAAAYQAEQAAKAAAAAGIPLTTVAPAAAAAPTIPKITLTCNGLSGSAKLLCIEGNEKVAVDVAKVDKIVAAIKDAGSFDAYVEDQKAKGLWVIPSANGRSQGKMIVDNVCGTDASCIQTITKTLTDAGVPVTVNGAPAALTTCNGDFCCECRQDASFTTCKGLHLCTDSGVPGTVNKDSNPCKAAGGTCSYTYTGPFINGSNGCGTAQSCIGGGGGTRGGGGTDTNGRRDNGGGGNDATTSNSNPTAPQCVSIVAYKDGNALSSTDLSALHVGDTVTLAYAPGGAATKVRFRINTGDWHESTTKNSTSQFVWDYTLTNSTNFSIEAQWFDGSAWH